jgi:hypothetical protein
MSRPALEVADIVQRYGALYLARYGPTLSPEQRQVLRMLALCRTAALGGHTTQCTHCGYAEMAYNSCRNRHCPKCQGPAQAAWLTAREADLLEVPYFHLVFTLPDPLRPLAFQHPRLLYALLFRTVKETLLTLARDPRHLGAEIGGLAVLHTWGQTLQHHPHVHCVVPGGGLSGDGEHWVSCRPTFFLPVRVLSRLFRRLFLTGLDHSFRRGLFPLQGHCAALADPSQWAQFLATLHATDWVVYAKPPFGGPQQVLKYLARYTHRVAISNRRLLALEEDKVTFQWKDYAHGNRQRTMTLDALEFLRRFLLHVLPKGFQRIRQFGFLANRVRRTKLTVCRALLQPPMGPTPAVCLPAGERPTPSAPPMAMRCPTCQRGRMVLIATLSPHHALLVGVRGPPGWDTS